MVNEQPVGVICNADVPLRRSTAAFDDVLMDCLNDVLNRFYWGSEHCASFTKLGSNLPPIKAAGKCEYIQ